MITCEDETNKVTCAVAFRDRFMQYHAFRAVWCARAAAIPNKVLGTSLEVSTVRVMAVMMTTVLIIVSVQVVTHGDAAGFDYPGCLILTSVRFIGEAFGALFRLL